VSRTNPTDVDRAELLITCNRCGAARGTWCTNVRTTWKWAEYLHSNRWQQADNVGNLIGLRRMYNEQTDRIVALRKGLHDWRQHVYDSTTYDSVYLRSRIDALLEQS